ncbi:hypothetical protein [Christiangramia echinicola]|uniref:Uncharacterized protein n=1 Tax=Christiangramia echinicola TaxID=279359 RepID=A0A1H1LD45_9FLAO|nr:hypothetical protein [Christiangramia echinicola]SDR72426.1 hypothetical protein SAMN04488552_0717 [Christiangramia echinicola]
MKNIITILILVFTVSMSANNLSVNESNFSYEEISSAQDIHPELIKMLKSGEIQTLKITYNEDFSCTLSAEVSYKGAALTLSITADTCEEAGAGLAQATRGFIDEVNAE